MSADPGLSQRRDGAWDHRRCGAHFTLPFARLQNPPKGTKEATICRGNSHSDSNLFLGNNNKKEKKKKNKKTKKKKNNNNNAKKKGKKKKKKKKKKKRRRRRRSRRRTRTQFRQENVW